MSFTLIATDPSSRARRGRLTTAHGVIETPVFMPVGTQGLVKAVSPRELRELRAQIIPGVTSRDDLLGNTAGDIHFLPLAALLAASLSR